jgi:NADH-quinone oxidoreductase subunit L
MQELIWLLPTFPLAGFLVLVLTAGALPRGFVAVIGAGSIGLSFLTALIIALEFLGAGEDFFCKRSMDLDVCWKF